MVRVAFITHANAWFREKYEFFFLWSFDFQWQVTVLKKASYWQTVEKL